MEVDARLVAVAFSVVLTACVGTDSAQQLSEATKPNIACPARDFGKFLEAFSDSADVQRRFTSLPLEFGLADPGNPAQEYTRRMIGAFEKIPGQSGGRIFPSKSQRTRGHVLMNDMTGEAEVPEYPEERRSPDDRVVKLSMAETGFHIYYRFAQSEGCWFLRAIHDKST
jgi:hypothetical protein